MSLYEKTNLLITANAVKAGKLYSVIPSNGSGDCTVTRNTTATRVNSLGLIENVAANVPRLNYDIAGVTPSVLVEPQRTNLVKYSEDFSNSLYSKIDSNVSIDLAISPSGIQNADRFFADGSSSTHIILQQQNTTAGLIHTFSVYVKSDTGRYILIRIGTGNFAKRFGITFDLQTGTITQTSETTSAPTGVSSSVQNAGNGWYRISLSLDSEGTNTGVILETSDVPTPALNQNLDYSHVGTQAYYLWGAQLEQGFATSYIPTIAAAVTRNADVITVSPPAGTVKITSTFSNDTTQVLTVIPATFTVLEGLTKQVLMQNSL